MYTRVPSKNNNGPPIKTVGDQNLTVQLPKNYSGNAFSSDGQMRPLAQETTQTPSPAEVKTEVDKPVPHLSPSVSPTIPSFPSGPLGYSDYPTEDSDVSDGAPEEENPYAQREIQTFNNTPASIENPREGGSFFSSMLGGNFGENFPFGHGLGSEELLILGLMLAIYLSENRDSELMMLLGILLFAG